MEETINCNLFRVHYFKMIKQNIYLFTENLDQLSNLSIGFAPVISLLIDIYPS